MTHQATLSLVYFLDVKQCPSILNEYTKRKNDPEYVRYIRQSNANCNYASQAVCCPIDGASQPEPTAAPITSPPVTQPPVTQPAVTTHSRLLTRDEGCGVTKVPHNRVVGGVPAKKGKSQVQVH